MMRRLGLILVVLAMGTGCSDCSESKPAPPPKTVKKDADAKDMSEDAKSIQDLREAFGVSLPPEVIRVYRADSYVRVETRLKLKDVKSFYESKLVDYELIEHRRQLRFIGLRDFMPEIKATQMAWKAPTVIVIRKRESTISLEEPKKEEKRPKTEVIVSGADKKLYVGKYEKGSPVMLKTPEGELLAPGARWGEPYVPPEGTPLHKTRYKSHFGKPFGEWTLQ